MGSRRTEAQVECSSLQIQWRGIMYSLMMAETHSLWLVDRQRHSRPVDYHSYFFLKISSYGGYQKGRDSAEHVVGLHEFLKTPSYFHLLTTLLHKDCVSHLEQLEWHPSIPLWPTNWFSETFASQNRNLSKSLLSFLYLWHNLYDQRPSAYECRICR